MMNYFEEVDVESIRDGIKVENLDEKTRLVEKEKMLFDGKIHSILFPHKEGTKNFRHLDGEKKEELREQYPYFKKENGTLQFRTSIGYFPGDEEEGKEMIVTGYNNVSDFIIGVAFIATLIPSFIGGFKAGIALIKKLSAK